jgi:hypothetical protein
MNKELIKQLAEQAGITQRPSTGNLMDKFYLFEVPTILH